MANGEREPVEWITVGVVAAAHGVRGEVRIFPTTDFPKRLLGLGEAHLLGSSGRRPVRVEGARPHARGLFVMKLSGVDDRDAAEALRGAELQVRREEAMPLPEGRYYVFELIGCRVEEVDGTEIGRLVDVITTAANDVYVVQSSERGEILIPAVRQVVRSVLPDEGRIVVDLPPGL